MVGRPLRFRFYALPAFVLLALILPFPVEASTATSVQDAWENVRVSWAAGLVVPDGAALERSASLSWSTASNLTATFQLPNITKPSGITYALLSAMVSDRSVLQVGMGVWPGREYWTVYSWQITGLDTPSPSYKWMANSTTPRSSSGTLVSASIFHSQSGWMFSITDESSGSSVKRTFPETQATSFASGDQEVFALESYTQSPITFASMGNMTLESLFVDGQRVIGGWYAYVGWDGVHYPLFVVGSTNAPYFIRVALTGGQVVWSHNAQWREAQLASVVPVVLGLAITFSAIAVVFLARRRRGPETPH